MTDDDIFEVGAVVELRDSVISIGKTASGWLWSDGIESGATDDEVRSWVLAGSATVTSGSTA